MANVKEKIDPILLKVQKPARYIGGELNSVVKDKKDIDVRFAFCFPDTYEIGMSHLGIKILYSLINERENYWCERVFAPLKDYEEMLRANDIPLYALESLDSIADFDIIGFTMQYELSYNTMLNMLDMAGVPLLSEEREGLHNLVVAGGPCVCNPEPIADFVDICLPGEGEEVLLELMDLYDEAKKGGWSKKEFLEKASQIGGVYVPSLYEVDYNEDGTVHEIKAIGNAPMPITKRIIKDLSTVFYPEKFIVPFIDTVHDRAVVEVLRGCVRGCRFCQAGFIYRPFREKSSDVLVKNCKSLCDTTGYEEVSLSSLSTSDYTQLESLLNEVLDYSSENKVNFSLPSLRVDNFSQELLNKIKKVRKSGLTFAPEAGTQRMRDVINKNVTKEDVLKSCLIAFVGGYTSVKLYFMLGLPTEMDEDMVGIIDLAQEIVDAFYRIEDRPKGKGVQVTVSVSTFVPKPFTPFQYEPQDRLEEIERKQRILIDSVKTKKIKLKYHHSNTSVLEAVMARGDRRMGKVILNAYKKGCYFDSWEEHFKYDKWIEAFEECGLDPDFYAHRKREYSEVLPWSHLDYGISEEFLRREHKKAVSNEVTKNCMEKCANCTANKFLGGNCFEY